MKILYAAMKYDYGKRERGFSFEHWNFYDSLRQMGHDILYFDFMTLFEERGRDWTSRRLVEVARSEHPDVLFCVLFTDELDPDAVEAISRETDTVTLNWFCDDHWRFEDFSRHWAPRFDYVVTTASSAMPKYAAIGYDRAIKSQWACNHHLYRRLDVEPIYDVTFIGQPHGNRRAVVGALRRAGIDVRAWGTGWESDRLEQEEMIRVLNQSRITLNLSNASRPRRDIRSLASAGVSFARVLASTRSLDRAAVAQLRAGSARYADQIKARNFEAPGCGTFLLTGSADDLERYYDTEREVVAFEGVDDLIDKLRYYLDDGDARRAVADAGYTRTLREHTYDHRFATIFDRIGLASATAGEAAMGATEDVGYPTAGGRARPRRSIDSAR